MPWTDSDTAAASQLAAASIDALSAANANRKGRKWAEEQYQKQRADALADWNMQNFYNSPAEQMKRFEAAGLNKNLIYGSNQNGPVVRSTDTQSWKPEAPQIGRSVTGAAQSFLASTDLEMRQAQTDNIKANNKNILLDSMLKAGQLNQLGIQTKTSEFNLQQLKNLSMLQLESAALNVEKQKVDITKTKADTGYTLQQTELSAASNAQNIAESIERINSLRASRSQTQAQTDQIRQSTQNLKQDANIKRLDEKLAEAGIRPGSTPYNNLLNELFRKGSPTHDRVKEVLDKIDTWLPEWLKMHAK